jgi:hypothetical protein
VRENNEIGRIGETEKRKQRDKREFKPRTHKIKIFFEVPEYESGIKEAIHPIKHGITQSTSL